jgi:hypothetical protein
MSGRRKELVLAYLSEHRSDAFILIQDLLNGVCKENCKTCKYYFICERDFDFINGKRAE